MKLFKLFSIPLVITALYLALQAFLLVTHFGVFSVVEETPVDFKKTNQQDVHLLKNQKAIATFKASENNLGIVLVQLVKFGQGRDDIIFRIKKEGEEKWYHESKFSGDQVQNDKYFPLGFPPIINSQNNTYVFELESLAGEYSSGVGLIKDKPAAVMYKYSVRDLKNYKTLSFFAYKKLLYIFKNIDYLQAVGVFAISYFLAFFIKRLFINLRINLRRIFKVIINITPSTSVKYLQAFKTNSRKTFKAIIHEIRFHYLSLEKKIVNFSKIINHWFTSIKFYLLFLNTNTKKRVVVGLLIFLFAFAYRFSSTLVNQSSLFYATLGGQGDYDQFIRAATCAVTNFCPAILGQNFLIESSILGVFYKIFGFTEALKVYLYLMLVLSSIVATLPHFLLSRKGWVSIGGIIGSLFLATSDFLTQVALNFPPDNGSLFAFSIFFIVYFLALNIGTIRWLLFFGLMGTIDGLNKALFLINDLAAFALFVPVFFYEKVKEANGSLFKKMNIKILFLSSLPLFVFLIIYGAWEYFVYIKFSARYFLGELITTKAGNYIAYTSLNDSSLTGNIVLQLFYFFVSAIVMVKRLIAYADLGIIFLAPIFLGLFFFTFLKKQFPIKKFISMILFSGFVIALLILIKENYFKIHEIFPGEYIPFNWKTETYVGIYLFFVIVFLFILNFKYSVIKLALPIIPYVVMLIILAKNSPFARLNTHVVAWSIILFAFIIEWMIISAKKNSTKASIALGFLIFISFILLYISPKVTTMLTQLNTGFVENQNHVRYLKWAEEELPSNAVVLAGGKSDLVTVAENIKRPIIYNSLYRAALLIIPNEIPGAKPTDFGITGVGFLYKGPIKLKINKIPGVKPTDFSIVSELKNKDNFKKNKYIILEDDVSIWRGRVTGVADNVFSTTPDFLHADDYSIKVYKFNPILKKTIYELNIIDPSVN